MSQIFDALQRAEAELAGAEAKGQAKATDILQRVEERFVAGNGTADRVVTLPAEKSGVRDAMQSAHREGKLQIVAFQSDAEPVPAVFEKFQTLKGKPESTNTLVSVTQPETVAAEAFRLLAIRLNDFKQARQMKKVLVTSSIPQEGKSMVAANLACALAKSDNPKTLLLEGDMRRPTLSSLFDVQPENGIAEFLEGKCSLEESIYFIEGAGVWLLPAGRASVNPQELMHSERLASLVAEVGTWFDWVVIDSPPVLPMADTSIWIRIADGILLTARQGKTEKKALKGCVDALDQDKVIGAILNSARIPEHADYYYRPIESDQG